VSSAVGARGSRVNATPVWFSSRWTRLLLRSRGGVLALALGGVLALAGCAAGTNVAGQPSAQRPGVAALARALPSEITIARIGAHSTLVELGLEPDDTVQVPPVSQPMQAGWYSLGPAPGEDGPAVILGHVNGNHKPGIFARLHEVRAGDEILIGRDDGSTAVFTVRRTEQVPKERFPTEEVYGKAGGPELRVITCGGGFDQARHSYRDNVIVYATLTGTR
jgi:Sortase domain